MLDNIQRGWRKPGWLNYILLPVSWLYSFLVFIRRVLYKIGILQSTSLGKPVVVVGGISVGGVGKTPVVVELIRHFRDKGYQPGVISRGYGGHSDYWPRQVDEQTDAGIVGDEPQLIFELTGAPVVVGPDRVADGRYLIDKLGCDMLISDDGFAHHKLRRDIDIVVVDGQFGSAGLGNGWCLPAGPLRESSTNLGRADMVVVNGVNESTGKKSQLLVSAVDQYRMSMELNNVRSLKTGEIRSLESFSDGPVFAVAGLGNPERFFLGLERAGLSVIRKPFPDHHRFVQSDIPVEILRGKNRPVLITEKDGIKCRDLGNLDNLWVVPGHGLIEKKFYEQLDRLMEKTLTND
jgi:tetraacyldisaccharide 4'-kinase